MIILELLLFSLVVLLMVLVTVPIVYSTIKLGITPMPSSSKAYLAMMQLVDETDTGVIADLGSGWGNVVIRLAKKHPNRKVIGYELSYLPWLISTILKKLLGLKNLTLYRQDFYQVDLSKVSVVVCYLFPEAMKKISDKLQLEKPNIEFLISNNFVLPNLQPCKVIKIDDFYKSPVYLYKF